MAISEFTKKYEWDKLDKYKTHMILMYLYRCDTDPDSLEQYIETQRYRESGFNLEMLPFVIKNMKPENKRSLAYMAIGKPVPS